MVGTLTCHPHHILATVPLSTTLSAAGYNLDGNRVDRGNLLLSTMTICHHSVEKWERYKKKGKKIKSLIVTVNQNGKFDLEICILEKNPALKKDLCMPLNFFRIKDLKEIEKRPKEFWRPNEFLKAKSKVCQIGKNLDFNLLNQGVD